MSASMKSASCGFNLKEIIRGDRLAWSLMIGGVAVAVVSFFADGAVEEFVSATCEEFWTILVVTLLSLCISEWRGATKKQRAKRSPESEGAYEAPKKEADAPRTQAGGNEGKCQQKDASATHTAQYIQAMGSGNLLLADAALELLEGLQASGGRASLGQFCGDSYGELARGLLKAGQAQRAGRWFGALVRTVPEPRPGCPGVPLGGEERERRQEIDGLQRQISELVRKSAREGSVQEAAALLSALYDAAPVACPDVACFTSVISACAKAGDVGGAEAWLAKLLALGLCPDEANYAALVNAYARKGDIEKAEGWLREMRTTFTEARTQSYRFDLVFQACGQINAAGKGSCGSGAARSASGLRADAPEFPGLPAGDRSTGVPWFSCGLRADAPEFQPETAAT